ncbi:TetR/AcrR family transcriptional regulator [Aquicoccus porphyridii]|uniref:TetR/AcrR family transcriptional regulator n=1 Tax=Aquicoccus porphyridii TaxID=1852029 RepID=A0A5A9YXD8_9RHOB|nr:TetR/AcrR family transcriptional regulator [Aquicoccus porphyridii]KAA0909516.1 TetR/AcrR family transcriptional regulator [Aquicoccus porphyridii]RAI52017.1 TetR family transcriptional regulator [Rhodobacteraceae bacterium AsT-22]
MATRKRRPGEKHGDLKAALLQAAGKRLEQDGPEKLSLRAVARLAGVSQTAPYNHFANREGLLAALAAQGFERLATNQAAAAQANDDPRIALECLGYEYTRFARGHPKLYRLMFGAGVGGEGWHDDELVTASKSRSFAPLRDVICRLLPEPVSPEQVDNGAMVCWAFVHGLSAMLIDGTLADRVESDDALAELSRQSIAIILDGVT